MSLLNIVLILVCVLGISAGQILFKLASPSIPGNIKFQSWLLFLLNQYFITALGIYGAATILWIFVLKRVNLGIAYPFMALAFIIVPLAGQFFLGESITYKNIIGALLIILGLTISVQ